MNILIPHSWLSEFLKTEARPEKIGECLSLCGPTVERIEKTKDDVIYDIEVTTNRVDLMSVYGIAREASVILPEFGYKAKLKPYLKGQAFESSKKLEIKIRSNIKLCKRILAVKLEGVNLGQSPSWLSERLIKVGQRPLNNAIDITNYVMWEIGHPIHVFDFDRLSNKNILVREAKKGESLITLDGVKYTLNGGEVVFDDGKGEIIDLPGIMGTANSVVTPNTKNVLLWIESIDPTRIRRASMGLDIRTQAAILNEKQVDPELGMPAILRAVELFEKIAKAKTASKLVDIYPSPYIPQKIKTTKTFIDERLGINIDKNQIKSILSNLEFRASWSRNNLEVEVPSFRAQDVAIPEDIIEEVARIYGYHKFPSMLMQGALPEKLHDSPFDFENKVKNILKGWGGVEVYTFSMVPKESVEKGALKLTNPLGKDSEYLRTSLMPSLIEAATQNSGEKEPFHIFEVANVYLPKPGSLPMEKMMLAGIFSQYNFRGAKGIVESLLQDNKIDYSFEPLDSTFFAPGRRVEIRSGKLYLGQFGILDGEDFIYYEFDCEALRKVSATTIPYKTLPKYPPQIEDITLVLPQRTKVGDVLISIKSVSYLINEAELIDIFKDAYTFRIWYQNPKKTLSDAEVEEIRKKILGEVKKKFGAIIKS